MKRCVINVAAGAWYPRGQDRLRASLQGVGFQGDFVSWRDTWPPGSPPHFALPYGFKSYAFQQAVSQGYETILWLDCSCWAVRPLEPLFDHIEQEGHVLSREKDPRAQNWEGWTAGQWLKDEALANLGITRDVTRFRADQAPGHLSDDWPGRRPPDPGAWPVLAWDNFGISPPRPSDQTSVLKSKPSEL